MQENIFEDAASQPSGIKVIRTLINQNSINYLTKYTYPKRIDMKHGENPIFVNDQTCSIYQPFNCESYSSPETGNWSLIAVYHQNIGFTKDEILNQFFELVGDSYFIPISFRRDKLLDFFFVTSQNDALREIFKHKLQILVNGWKLPVLVKTEVSKTMEGQVRPKRSMGVFLQRKIKELSPTGWLDLSNISKEPEFTDFCLSLRNKGVMKMFFDEINSIKAIKSNSKIRGINLSKNEIKSLEYFKHLYDFKYIELLNLSTNNITDYNELKNLKDFHLQEIIMNANPCINSPKFEEIIIKILPGLKQFKYNSKVVFQDQSPLDIQDSGNKEISNISDGTLIKPNNYLSYRTRFDKLINQHYWSQVTIFHNKRFSVYDIMKELSSTILKDVHFYPCYMKRLDNRDVFYLYRNIDALRNLFLSNLKIQMPNNSFTIEVHIRLNVAEYKKGEVYWSNKISRALLNRIKDNILDLNDFPKDPEFSKMFVLMNSTAIDFILSQARKLDPDITRINAENCKISNSKGFECLFTFPKLTALNLRNNDLNSLEDFSKCSTIKEIYLDGNPVCNTSSFEYIKKIRDNFKQIEWIDRHKVFEDNCIVTYQNFIISNNASIMVEEFVQYFFKIWDSFERSKLLQMYKDTSIFTLSIHYDYDEKNCTMQFAHIYSRIQAIIKFNRNLEKISNLNQSLSNVFVGNNIARVFGDMCRTRHDFSTFTVDVPFFNIQHGKFKLVVGGIFEEYDNNSVENLLPFSFSRAFIIEICNGRFSILNDQLSLRGPTAIQAKALKNRKKVATQLEIQEQCRNILPSEFENQAAKLIMLQKLTECNKKYCKTLLEQYSWDLKIALSCFNDRMANNEIPDDVFKF